MSPKLKLWAKRMKGPKGNAFRGRQAAAFGREVAREIIKRQAA